MSTLKRLTDEILEHRGPITASDLVERSRYERHRGPLLEWSRSLKAQRRFSVGPDFTLLFENPATVWIQIQEELRWVTDLTARRLQSLLREYNRLIASPGELRGCLFMDTVDIDTIASYRAPGALEALDLTLHLGVRGYTAQHLEGADSGIDPVTFVVFVPRTRPTIGPERLSWSGPRSSYVELLPATRAILRREVDMIGLASSESLSAPPSCPWVTECLPMAPDC